MSYHQYSGCDHRDTVGVMSDIVAVKLHNVCVVIALCVMPYSGYIINRECGVRDTGIV